MAWRAGSCLHSHRQGRMIFRIWGTWDRSRTRSQSMRSWHGSLASFSHAHVRHAMLLLDAPVRLRLMTEQDLSMLHNWLNRPHIVEWWGGERPTLGQVRHHYLPRVLAQQRVTPYIATLD